MVLGAIIWTPRTSYARGRVIAENPRMRVVRLAAGRRQMSPEGVTLCFLAGANSIFTGEKLLTTPNPSADADEQLLENLGMKAMQSA